MDTIFINTENSKANESNRFRLYFTNKLDLRRNKTISYIVLKIKTGYKLELLTKETQNLMGQKVMGF